MRQEHTDGIRNGNDNFVVDYSYLVYINFNSPLLLASEINPIKLNLWWYIFRDIVLSTCPNHSTNRRPLRVGIINYGVQ